MNVVSYWVQRMEEIVNEGRGRNSVGMEDNMWGWKENEVDITTEKHGR